MKCQTKDDLVIIDEHIAPIDKMLTRYIFCFVEIKQDDRLKQIIENLDLLRKKFHEENPKKKFHLTDMADGKFIDAILEEIIQLRPTAKLFISYCKNTKKTNKRDCLKKAIGFTKPNYSTKTKWLIEDAEDYKGMINSKNLIEKSSYTIIPDVFCGLFARYLDGGSRDETRSKEPRIAYEKFRNLVRLQVYWVGESDSTVLRRGNML